jgi:penicillin-binding protein 1C
LAYEDRLFRYHPGVNPYSLGRALVANIRARRIRQGGSTITMQVARLMEPKARTIPNKLAEIFRALQLEITYSKAEILTHYFNLAPYGGNLVGVGAAARFYLDKNPSQLSLGEAALLAAIPQDPNANRPDRDILAAGRARDLVLGRMLDLGKITEEEVFKAASEPLPGRRYDPPFAAPHLVTMLSLEHPERERIYTTIDHLLQDNVEDLLRRQAIDLRRKGITNAAAVVLDNPTGELLAMVGSVDFFDEEAAGQVNGALAPRSPGSALKPFVYALAMDRGLITPASLLADVPTDYSGYRPENYDGLFRGAVTAREALTASLNVPVVNLSAELGNRGLYTFLREAGVTTLPEAGDYYGLSLVLGGAGVNLLELANTYRGLAHGGRFSRCRLLFDAPESEGNALMSPGTCFIISEMLAELRRPEIPSVWEWARNAPKVAWKTGTSYGHRDAWSIGYTPDYTVGVWAGNFDGRGVPELIGVDVAAPILFELFTLLDERSDRRWFEQPNSVESRTVCALSGMPATEFCPVTKSDSYLPGLSSQAVCNLHQQIVVDKTSGHRLCSHCRIGHDCESRIVVQWPPDIATWMERNGHPIEQLPLHNPDCHRLASGKPPVISSPTDRAVYRLRSRVGTRYQKVLLDAQVSNGTGRIFWFVDGYMVYSGPPRNDLFISPASGRHKVQCLDDEGRSSEVEISVIGPF